MIRLLIFSLFFLSSYSLYLDLWPGDLRCIGQELDQLERVVFAFSASSKVKDPNQKVTVKVSDPEEEDIVFDKLPITGKMKEFEHNVVERGVHEMCFELHEGKTPVRIFLHADYQLDASRQVNKEEVPQLIKAVQLIESKVKEISIEIDHARLQEAALNAAGELTSSRLEWFSLLSILILLGTATWQILYLRSFFTSKKLL
eukprot:gene11252-12552_t